MLLLLLLMMIFLLLQINTDYRNEFARCLEPLLLLGPRCPPAAGSTCVPSR